MAALTEWLNLMLAEIARKREEAERARAEDAQRATEEEPAGRTDSATRSTARPR
jgi:hypothetical protein